MKFRRILLFTIVLFMICFTLRVKVAKGETAFILQSPWLNVTSGMILPDDGFIGLTAESETDCALVLGTKGKAVDMLTTHTFSATALSAGDNNNKKLALGSLDGSIILRNASEVLALKKKITNDHYLQLPPEKPVTAVAFSPDEQTLASGTEDGTIAVWDTESRELLFLLSGIQKNDVTTVSFSPDGMYLASGAMDGSVILWNLWNVPKPREVLSLNRHNGSVNTIAFSPNSQTLATGAEDKLINLWKIPEKSEPTVLEGHAGAVKAISFSPDGIHLASGGSFGEVLLWDIPNNTKIEPRTRYFKVTTLEIKERAHEKDIVAITFSENGNKLISICQEKHAEWSLKEIKINPEPSELFFAEKPKPLIEKRREQDEIAPIVDNVVYEDEVDSETAGTIVSGRVTDLNEIRSFTVNGENVKISENGEFETSVNLEVGKNEIPIVAIDRNGNRNDEIKLEIERKRSPDITRPIVKVINKEFNEVNVAYVEYNQDVFEVQVEATDDNSGVKEVRVNGQPANANVNQRFTARVHLQDRKNIVVVAEDNSGNTSDVLTLTVHRKPKPDTELPVITIEGIADGEQPNVETDNRRLSQKPKIDPNVDTTLENTKLDSTTTNRSVSSPVTIHITDPDMIEDQVQLLRAYPEDEPTCEVSGAVENYKLASSHIDIIIKSKTEGNIKKPFQDSTRLLQLGIFKFKDLPLFIGENEITLKIDLKDGTGPITKRFLIQRISSQSPNRPIQPPGPIDSPTIPPPVQNNKPPTLNVSLNVEKRSSKGTQDVVSQEDVHAVTEVSESNTNRKKIVASTEEIVFEGTVKDDNNESFELKLEIDNTPIGIEQDGGFKYSYSLEYGPNQITVTATDKDDEKTTEEYTVYYRPDRDGKDFALFFAMDDYDDTGGWTDLATPIKDAENIAGKLEKNYGFKTKVIPNPIKNTIVHKLVEYREEFIDEHGNTFKYPKDSQLLIYFSGHGFSKKMPPTSDGEGVEVGFIAPIDSVAKEKNENRAESSSLSFMYLRQNIDLIVSQRILVLVDTCQSGFFDPYFQRAKSSSNSSSNDPMEKINDNFEKKARRYLTATGEESALDGTPDKSRSSPFAEAFIKALDTKGSEDHLLEVDEVSDYIKKTKDHPDYRRPGREVPEPKDGHFESSESGSNFLFFPLPPF